MKDTLYKAFETKYEELKEALSGDDFNSNDVSSHDAYFRKGKE